jgi:DNA-binding LacI/PurR family transcriptional regulator
MIPLDKSAHTPLYQQIKAGLLERIRAGEFPPGQPLPTERDLAVDLGLSRLTVRRAIVELAEQGLLHRIPGRGTYVADASVAPVATTTANIAFVLPYDRLTDRCGRFLMRLLNGLQEAAQPAALSLRRMTATAGDLARELRAEPGIRGLAALWIMDPAALGALAATGIPLVGYECAAVDGLVGDAIGHANEEGACAAVRSLIGLGHRDIACLVHATSEDPAAAVVDAAAGERRAGFERALRQHGLPARPGLVRTVLPTSESGYLLMRRLLAGERSERPTAVFCSDDNVAVGALAAARESGVRVPEDLSLVGFGDLGIFCTPALSSVRMEIEASGRATVRLLRERMADPALPPRREVLPTEFIRRASCAPPSSA